VREHLGGNVAGDARDLSRDAVRHDSPWWLVQTKRIRNSMRCGYEVTRRESRKQGCGDASRRERRPEGRWDATNHSAGGRISWRQASVAVFWSIAETEQYFFSLSSMAC